MENHINLIQGYLKRTLNKEETEQFFDWINQNPENKKLYFEAKLVFDASHPPQFDEKKSWQTVLEKRKTVIPRRHILWSNIRAYASVFLIASLLTSLLFIYNTEKTESPAVNFISGNGLEADKMYLPDGTIVSLGSKTTFTYQAGFGNHQRTVYLEGEAFFEVERKENIPFIVKINGQDIEVLGTKFNVTAYPGDSIFTTTVLEGSVQITTQELADISILKPNEQYIYNRNSKTVNLKTVEAEAFTTWTSGFYYFHHQSLETILDRLSHIYGVRFTIHSDKIKETLFTGTFYKGQSIQSILEIIQLSAPINYTVDNLEIDIHHK